MRSLFLTVPRACVSAWIGAAVLFVIVGVREVTSPDLTSEVKDRLVTMRFPAYYATGATLLGLSTLALIGARGPGGLSAKRWVIALTLLLIADAGMAADFLAIYQPLAAQVTPPGQPRTMQFISLHRWSMWVNAANLVMCGAAAVMLLACDAVPNPQQALTPKCDG